MSSRSPPRPGSDRRSSRSDTSANPFGSIGMWTRRPSVVTTTATWRRSWRSKRPKLASLALLPLSEPERFANDTTHRALVNGAAGRWRRVHAVGARCLDDPRSSSDGGRRAGGRKERRRHRCGCQPSPHGRGRIVTYPTHGRSRPPHTNPRETRAGGSAPDQRPEAAGPGSLNGRACPGRHRYVNEGPVGRLRTGRLRTGSRPDPVLA